MGGVWRPMGGMSAMQGELEGYTRGNRASGGKSRVSGDVEMGD
jgi:hypothetical protein